MNIDDTQNVTEFMNEIHNICRNDKLDYIDAIIHFCELNNLELEVIAQKVKKIPLLQSKIQEEAEQMNYIDKITRLPL